MARPSTSLLFLTSIVLTFSSHPDCADGWQLKADSASLEVAIFDEIGVDVTKHIAKEPDYVCDEPRYAVALFGEKSPQVIWFVLDKSATDADSYDTVFVDVNANGDLTEENEKFELQGDRRSAADLPELDFGSELSLTEFSIRLSNNEEGIGMINGMHEDLKLGGGYPVDPSKYMQFTEAKDEAPVVWFKPGVPFEFQRWIDGPLTIGEETDFKVFVGWKGQGPASFCTTLGHILPESEVVLTTLEYTDKDGVQQTVEGEFGERC